MPPNIQSTQNQRIKDAIKLRQRGGRHKQGRFAIDGLREIGHAIDGKQEIVESYVCEELLASDPQQQLVERLNSAGVPITTVSEQVWAKLTFGDRDDGVLAIARTNNSNISSLPKAELPLVVVLESVEKPGNVGAVLRSADAAGVTAVILAEPRTDIYNPNTIRASLGAIFRVPTVSASNEEVARWLSESSIRPLVARLDDSASYTEANFSVPVAIVLGSEANGVSEYWQRSERAGIRLPMLGQIDSLNVSNAAAILMYEAVRQRGS